MVIHMLTFPSGRRVKVVKSATSLRFSCIHLCKDSCTEWYSHETTVVHI